MEKSTPFDKADPKLRQALEEAMGESPKRTPADVLRTIMVLRSEASRGGGEAPAPRPLDPADYPSRIEYRKALIEQRQQVVRRDVGDVKRKLEGLALKVKGGLTSPTVVVEGPARRILDSLQLEGVEHASLDREIALERPTKAVPEEG
jgi:hypothetical protein